jgi:fluoroquinolone resistance protein
MSNAYFEDQLYEGLDYTAKGLSKGQYEGCSFVNCNLSNVDLSDISLTECTFRGCNLSNVKMLQTSLNDVKFINCKMLGIDYEHCNQFLFTVDFDNCVLNFSSFYKRGLKKTSFRNCSLQEVDFIEADLTGSVFDKCDLAGAKFENTVLDKVDFRTAFNYTIHPDLNRVKKAQFSLTGLPGLLTRYDIVITP